MRLIRVLAAALALVPHTFAGSHRETCSVKAGGSNETDDAPAVIEAFEKCGRGGRVIFEDTTYHINSVMNISWLNDVEIDIKGTLLVLSYLLRLI